jgi:PAS domain-containing protein
MTLLSIAEQNLMSPPASPLKHSSQAINPDEWNAWIGLGTAIGAGAVWLWRHSLGAFFLWLWNGLKAPSRIEQLFRLQKEQCALLQEQIHEAKHCAEFAMATSRIAWSFAECAVLQFDSLGLCLFANDYILRLLVRQQDEFQGSGWRTLIHPDDADRVERQWDASVRDRRNFSQAFRVLTAAGKPVRFQCRGEILHDRDGNVLGWYHILRIID